jgi:hypothetical protein
MLRLIPVGNSQSYIPKQRHSHGKVTKSYVMTVQNCLSKKSYVTANFHLLVLKSSYCALVCFIHPGLISAPSETNIASTQK